MTQFLSRGIQCGDRFRSATCYGHALECACRSAVKNNHVITIPRAASSAYRVAYGLYRPTCGIDPFKLALHEETNGPAVRRPERRRAPGADTFGSCQWMRFQRIDGPNPNATDVFGLGNKCNAS